MSDYCVRATAANGQIRAFAARTTELCEEARSRHDTFPTATAALGRLLTAGVMMGMDLQAKDTLTLRLIGDGPLGSAVVVAEHGGVVRGYVGQPHTHVPSKYPGKLDVGKAVGKNGFLHVTKYIGLGDPYTGSVPLHSGEIAEDFAKYYLESEQIPSVVALGVLVETDNRVVAAGGYILQLMPGAGEEIITALEKSSSAVLPVSTMIATGLSPEGILQEVLKDFDVKILGRQDVEYRCTCSRDRLERVLLGLGVDELRDMLEQEKKAELRCHFCNDVHNFDETELENILAEARRLSSQQSE